MSSELFEEIPALMPIDFFSTLTEVGYSKTPPSERQLRRSFLLPDTSEFLGEERFAEVAMSWSEEGIVIAAFFDKPFEEAVYPQFQQGDALEIFIDTRDVKTAGFIHRFCHRFVVLPQEVQGVRALELTHFRTEDTHPLCDPSDLQVEAEFNKKDFRLQLMIPASCLYGFDPGQFNRLGFNYRCHRYGEGLPQHFSVSSREYSIEQHPRLWGSLKLGEKK